MNHWYTLYPVTSTILLAITILCAVVLILYILFRPTIKKELRELFTFLVQTYRDQPEQSESDQRDEIISQINSENPPPKRLAEARDLDNESGFYKIGLTVFYCLSAWFFDWALPKTHEENLIAWLFIALALPAIATPFVIYHVRKLSRRFDELRRPLIIVSHIDQLTIQSKNGASAKIELTIQLPNYDLSENLKHRFHVETRNELLVFLRDSDAFPTSEQMEKLLTEPFARLYNELNLDYLRFHIHQFSPPRESLKEPPRSYV